MMTERKAWNKGLPWSKWMSKRGAKKARINLKPSLNFVKGHKIRNTGRTRFKKGRVPSKSAREKTRQVCIIRNRLHNPAKDPKVREKISATLTGRKATQKTRIKQSLAQRGNKGSNWQGGKTKEQKTRMLSDYREWRKQVFERDDFTCQKCRTRGGILEAHHIKPFSKDKKLRLDLNNGKTLCWYCHRKHHQRFK